MKLWPFAWILTILALAVSPMTVNLAWAQPAYHNATTSIPVDISVPFVPTSVLAEGQRHMIYELHVTNMGQNDLTLTKVEVVSVPTKKVLTSYSGDSLSAVMARPGSHDLPDSRVIAAGLSAVVFIDVIMDGAADEPSIIRHRLTFMPVTPVDAGREQSEVTGEDVPVNARAPVVLGPPLKGGGWLASHGLSNNSSHRRTLLTLNGAARIAQRFAIDWTRIGADGQIFRNDPSNNANWTPYGADVLAVADGRVVEITDNIPENDPTADLKAIAITFDTAPGNSLILDIGYGRYVLYAHLKPGSFRVRGGQSVKRGETLAALGNSGKADAPHLHFQVMDRPSPLAAEGLPFVFQDFDLLGHVASLRVFTDGSGWHVTAPPSHRTKELPVENAVVAFPGR